MIQKKQISQKSYWIWIKIVARGSFLAPILDFEAKESLKVKNSYLNEFLIPKLVKNDLLFVKIAPQIKKLKFIMSDGRHF